MSFNKYPPDPPARRSIWVLVALFVGLIVANVLHHTGVA